MGVAILVSEILLLSKTAKFPFPTMDYSPLSLKNLIIWNWLKKFIQVDVDAMVRSPLSENFAHFRLPFKQSKIFSDQSLYLHNVNFNNKNAISVLVESLCTLF